MLLRISCAVGGLLGLLGLGCRASGAFSDAAVAVDECKQFVGDPAQPVELQVGLRSLDGAFVALSDGDRADLLRPAQGGHVLFVTPHVRNVCADEVKMIARVWDDAIPTIPMAGPVTLGGQALVSVEEGWAHPSLETTGSVVNLNTCPNAHEIPFAGRTHRLELQITDDVTKRGASAEVEITPTCSQVVSECRELCECECGKYGSMLGRCRPPTDVECELPIGIVPDSKPLDGGAPDSAKSGDVPEIVAVSTSVVAHGATLTVTGAGLGDALAVTLGAVEQSILEASDTSLVILVGDATPLGAQPLVVSTKSGSSAPFSIVAIHLVLNEIESDQPSADIQEFVEISTGVPGITLGDYVLVFFNGANGESYRTIDLSGLAADSSGLILVGNMAVTPSPAATFPDGALQNGEDAVALYQGATGTFPTGTPATGIGLIDVLVYETGADADTSLDSILLMSGGVLNEGAEGDAVVTSCQRCGPARRAGDEFEVGPPSPGLVNDCP